MKLALYQGPSPAGDMALALKKVESVLSSAAMSDVQMVVFPELFLPGYNQPDLHHSMAQPQGGEWEQALRDIANTCGCGLTIGWAESDNGRYYNAASCFDQAGNKIAHYRKLQLFGAMEKTNFEFGESYTTFQWADFKVALLICYDVEFSHHVQRLKNQGVSLLLVPTANPSQYDNVSKLLVPARAFESGTSIVYANYCGHEGDLHYSGLSLIVGPDGEPIAQAGRGEALLIADLDHISNIDPAVISTQHLDFREVT